MTARAWRIFLVTLGFHAVVATGLGLLMAGVGFFGELHSRVFLSALSAGVTGQFTPFLLVLSNCFLWPIEQVVRQSYLSSAARRITAAAPKIVAVTGSYGKTTTKEIIAHILSSRYRVLKTPASYNTLMGVCKVIRGELLPGHDFFVVEMGAYKRKSIARLCDLTRPLISVITTIGVQHLERFGSVEKIKLAKAEIIEALSPEGVAVLNGDNPACREVEWLTKARIVRFGLGSAKDLDFWARNVRFSAEGVDFTLHGQGGRFVQIQSKLLGRHSIMNILAATAVVLELGLSLEEVSDRLRTLEPVPHRLQPLKGVGGVTIIDDAYNANPEGAIAALETLAEFKGRKILITPGLVELGERGFEENKKIGIVAAGVCDVVLLVGPQQTLAIQEGLAESGFDHKDLRVFVDSQEAIKHLWKMTRPGDVVLFENDLPDQYDEGSQPASARYAHAKA
jgi:UDP-N-acetylmuramoyl-tripeptide--D-alanyl-D-alanine ligase